MNAVALVGRLIRIAGFLALLGMPLTGAADLPDFTELVEQNHTVMWTGRSRDRAR